MAQLAFLMESVGIGEWFVLLAVILIVVGPQRLPELARKLGRWSETFRRAAEEFKRQILSMDEEINHQSSEYTDYANSDYGSSDGEDQSDEKPAPEDHAETDDTASPEPFSETEVPDYQAPPSAEGLPESAPYYGNEELVAEMQKNQEKEEQS